MSIALNCNSVSFFQIHFKIQENEIKLFTLTKTFKWNYSLRYNMIAISIGNSELNKSQIRKNDLKGREIHLIEENKSSCFLHSHQTRIPHSK